MRVGGAIKGVTCNIIKEAEYYPGMVTGAAGSVQCGGEKETKSRFKCGGDLCVCGTWPRMLMRVT